MNYNITEKKPRIAFCFSGQARTLAQTYSLFQENLFDAAKEQGFDYDVFCAVEDDEDVDKVKLLHPTKVEKIKSSEVKEIINQKWGHFIEHEYIEKYGGSGKDWVANLLQQFYKICESINLKKQYQFDNNILYDMVFKLRFDTPFPRKLNFKNILKTINKFDKIVLCNRNKLIPSLKFIIKIEDFYFIMNDNTSNILGDIFNNWDVCLKGCEIRHNKLNKIFRKIGGLSKSYIWEVLMLPIAHIYAIFFHPFSAEIYAYNYFKNNDIMVDTSTYITIWLIRDIKKYKKLNIRTHTKKWMFKKGDYEI